MSDPKKKRSALAEWLGNFDDSALQAEDAAGKWMNTPDPDYEPGPMDEPGYVPMSPGQLAADNIFATGKLWGKKLGRGGKWLDQKLGIPDLWLDPTDPRLQNAEIDANNEQTVPRVGFFEGMAHAVPGAASVEFGTRAQFGKLGGGKAPPKGAQSIFPTPEQSLEAMKGEAIIKDKMLEGGAKPINPKAVDVQLAEKAHTAGLQGHDNLPTPETQARIDAAENKNIDRNVRRHGLYGGQDEDTWAHQTGLELDNTYETAGPGSAEIPESKNLPGQSELEKYLSQDLYAFPKPEESLETMKHEAVLKDYLREHGRVVTPPTADELRRKVAPVDDPNAYFNRGGPNHDRFQVIEVPGASHTAAENQAAINGARDAMEANVDPARELNFHRSHPNTDGMPVLGDAFQPGAWVGNRETPGVMPGGRSRSIPKSKDLPGQTALEQYLAEPLAAFPSPEESVEAMKHEAVLKDHLLGRGKVVGPEGAAPLWEGTLDEMGPIAHRKGHDARLSNTSQAVKMGLLSYYPNQWGEVDPMNDLPNTPDRPNGGLDRAGLGADIPASKNLPHQSALEQWLSSLYGPGAK